ncbi:hypothetical protein KFK09_017729 [Dendrobium nobile]|uniref:Uncharacterized protein n=1 Tax=Dendrobium nobile TaxID=94219 RepID=A0A8T3AZ97_DENNO|nr:hypothetical protein KFK09_017729 [Dendrobium nobile]
MNIHFLKFFYNFFKTTPYLDLTIQSFSQPFSFFNFQSTHLSPFKYHIIIFQNIPTS